MKSTEITLNDGRVIKYKITCKHHNLKYLETIDTYDMDGWPVTRDVYICLDCGITFEK